MDIRAHHLDDLAELGDRVRREKDAHQRDRYRVVVLAIESYPTATIQQMTSRSRGFVQRWVYAYRDGGLEAIEPKRRGGSAPKLHPDQQTQFIKRFKEGPIEADAGICTLRGKDGQRILETEFGINYSLPGVYKLLHRHGLSCLKPRPRHRKQEPQAQAQWVEQTPFLSKKSAKPTLKNKSRSGSKTKLGLVNKAR